MIINSNGDVSTFYHMGYSVFHTYIMIYHALIIVETRNWTWWLVFVNTTNFFFYLPLQFFFNNGGTYNTYQIEGYQHNMSMFLKTPSLHLSSLLVTFAVVGPRYAYLCFEHVVWKPEFVKIKGK